jgi:hypothetical protein
MNNDLIVPPQLSFEDLLPESAKTNSGVIFCPRLSRWAYREESSSVSLDFGALTGATPYLVIGLKIALLWYAENRSANHLMSLFDRMRHFLTTLEASRNTHLAEISSEHLINYRSLLTPGTRWYLGTLAGLLKKWHGLGHPGITNDAVAFLKQIKIAGNEKGAAVSTFDAHSGPFTDIELQAIQSAFNAAFAQGDVSLGDYMLGWLFMLLGQRPVQYALLKVCDLTVGRAKDGSATYVVKMPRAKQQGVVHRTTFKERLLTPQIGMLLVKYANAVKAQFTGVLEDPNQAPLFPQVTERSQHPEGFEFHRTSNALGRVLVSMFQHLSVASERTGQPMHIAPTRFRRTIGTRAAMEGHGELIIAELLDHNDTQNVGVYVQATPEILARIDQAIALQMAPLAQAFAGVYISDEKHAIRGGDPSSRIVAPQCTKSFTPVGNCGKYGFCGFMAPIACYTCCNFQAWLDGPHEVLLVHLVAERERLLVHTDARIASVNDRTILAVAQVVSECKVAKAKAMEIKNG